MKAERTFSPWWRQGFIHRQVLTSSTAILIYLSFLKLLLHLITNASGGYGYFRDEFYYIACSDHLDFGYVDHPPLSIVLLAFSRWLLGDSLSALRFLPALAGGLTVFITGLIVKELGGGRFAVVLAAVAALTAPAYLGINNYFSMNSFDILFWTLSLYVLILILKTENEKLWVLFGLVAGLSFQNKISILFLGFGLVAALLLTSRRKCFLSKWFWIGGLVTIAIAIPNLLWQMKHDWPTLEFMQRAQQFKVASISPLEFFLGQVLQMNPLSLPLWLAGLYYFLFSREGNRYRVLGLIYVVVFTFLTVQNAKVYYLSPIYPVVFASGAVLFQRVIERHSWNWLKPASLVLLVVSALMILPMALPVLPVETFIRYSKAVGVHPPAEERQQLGELPQHYADMFGWEEMVSTVALVYQSLPQEDQAKCGIYTQNYGEAGAIDFLGRRYNLPKATSGHNSYFLWGPGNYTGEVMIILGGRREDHEANFEKVDQAAVTKCEYCMPYENNRPIFIARKLKVPIKEIWPRTKHYI